MIQASELRIGNLINEALCGEIIVTPSVLQDLLNGAENYEPVQLTGEWLLKFGFEKDNDNVLKLGNCFYWLHNGAVGIFQIAIGYAPVINSPCNYVHQLQNLYFALTGVELSGF